MQTLPPLAWAILQNTLVALVPALLAIIARSARRPALAHVLWVLVLLKLITPPIWRVPIIPAHVDQSAVRIQLLPPISPAAPVASAADALPVLPENGGIDSPAIESTATPPSEPVVMAAASGIFIAKPAGARADGSCDLWIPLGVWIRGTWIYHAAAHRSVPAGFCGKRFLPRPHLRGMSRRIGRRLQLGRLPFVRMGPAGVSPLIWFLGAQPLLLVPANMFEMLTARQREAIIAHELAHLKRRDHWIRLLEMGITLLLWWHPLVWLARHGLRGAEEEACDAWVVWLTEDARLCGRAGEAAGYFRDAVACNGQRVGTTWEREKEIGHDSEFDTGKDAATCGLGAGGSGGVVAAVHAGAAGRRFLRTRRRPQPRRLQRRKRLRMKPRMPRSRPCWR